MGYDDDQTSPLNELVASSPQRLYKEIIKSLMSVCSRRLNGSYLIRLGVSKKLDHATIGWDKQRNKLLCQFIATAKII